MHTSSSARASLRLIFMASPRLGTEEDGIVGLAPKNDLLEISFRNLTLFFPQCLAVKVGKNIPPTPACTPRCFGYRNHTPEKS